MESKNKGAGEDMKFIFWDDPGDSQSDVDNQKPSCSNHDKATEDEEERLAEERMMIIIRNGNEGSHYPEYNDKQEQDDEK
jgi:hypothetical protein